MAGAGMTTLRNIARTRVIHGIDPCAIQSFIRLSLRRASSLRNMPPSLGNTLRIPRGLERPHPWVSPSLSPEHRQPALQRALSTCTGQQGMVGCWVYPGCTGWCIYQGGMPPYTQGGVYTGRYASLYPGGVYTGCTPLIP